MLVLSRKLKESVHLSIKDDFLNNYEGKEREAVKNALDRIFGEDGITISVSKIDALAVKVAIDASKDVKVLRSELLN